MSSSRLSSRYFLFHSPRKLLVLFLLMNPSLIGTGRPEPMDSVGVVNLDTPYATCLWKQNDCEVVNINCLSNKENYQTYISSKHWSSFGPPRFMRGRGRCHASKPLYPCGHDTRGDTGLGWRRGKWGVGTLKHRGGVDESLGVGVSGGAESYTTCWECRQERTIKETL